jgi:probable HAF family extracellular repeat protein
MSMSLLGQATCPPGGIDSERHLREECVTENCATLNKGDAMRCGLLMVAVCTAAQFRPAPLSAAISYSITALPTENQSIASVAINEDGLIALTSGFDDENQPNNVFLLDHGQLVQLTTLGGHSTFIADINKHGLMAGSSQASNGLSHAVRYENAQLQDLGTIPGEVALTAINDSGVSVGETMNLHNNRAVVATGPNQFTVLGTLGGHYSSANDINNMGQITGISYTSLEYLPAPLDMPVIEAFLFENGQMTGIGTLGGQISYGWGINDLSQIVGESSLLNHEMHAFVWDVTSGMRDLGTPGVTSLATHINNQGTIVGEVAMTAGSLRAAIFDEVTGYHLLQDLIPPNSGWTQLNYATDINDLGQIVGTGIYDGQNKVFLLTPVPEPENVATLLVGTMIAAVFGRNLSREGRTAPLRCSNRIAIAFALG